MTAGPTDVAWLVAQVEAMSLLADIEADFTRYVRTPEGARRYGLPIGSPIVAKPTPKPAKPEGDVRRPAEGVEVRTHGSGRLHVTSPHDKVFIAALKGMGARWLPKSKTWSVPAGRDADLARLVRDTFGSGEAVAVADLPHEVSVTTRPNGKIEVKAPYNERFRQRAREIGGAWDPTAKAWVFPPHREAQARAAVAAAYDDAWSKQQAEASRAKQQARQAQPATRGARPNGGATEKQRNLIRKLIGPSYSFDWHDFFDGAGGPAGQYDPMGPASEHIDEWLERLTVGAASALIDDLIAWKRGY